MFVYKCDHGDLPTRESNEHRSVVLRHSFVMGYFINRYFLLAPALEQTRGAADDDFYCQDVGLYPLETDRFPVLRFNAQGVDQWFPARDGHRRSRCGDRAGDDSRRGRKRHEERHEEPDKDRTDEEVCDGLRHFKVVARYVYHDIGAQSDHDCSDGDCD